MAKLEIREQITLDGKVVGIIGGYSDYIDCLYIKPEYRRRGLAKEAVLKYINGKIDEGIRFYLLNDNEEGLAFWNSICELKTVRGNSVVTLYEIVKIKEAEQ